MPLLNGKQFLAMDHFRRRGGILRQGEIATERNFMSQVDENASCREQWSNSSVGEGARKV